MAAAAPLILFFGGIVGFIAFAVAGYRAARFTSSPSGGKTFERRGCTYWWRGGATMKLELASWAKAGMFYSALLVWVGLLWH